MIPVDEEKLGVALTDLAGVAGSSNDGTIRFEPNKAVAVPGKAGKALEVNQSLISVRDAYRAQVQTGRPGVVELPVATSEPTISQAELDRAMKDFAEPAMSGLITIKAGPKQIQFGPAKSLPQILSMKPVDGRLVEVYDRKAIDTLLDGVFDGVMATKGDGKKHQVSASDVAQAMQKALLGRTPPSGPPRSTSAAADRLAVLVHVLAPARKAGARTAHAFAGMTSVTRAAGRLTLLPAASAGDAQHTGRAGRMYGGRRGRYHRKGTVKA
ncbi:hypothetical protein NKH18_33585 [Streptomyces sp. M10(2022)]